MPTPLAFPTTVELMEVERVLLPQLTMDDMIFQMFPIVEKNSWRLKWRQRDNFMGLQQVRGLGGEFKVVDRAGMKEYDFEPGVYGEFGLIEEEEGTLSGQIDSYTEFVDLTEPTGEIQAQLITREIDRIRKNLWDLCTTGEYKVFDKTGTLKHYGTFPLTTQSASVAWATAATATPYKDLVSIRLKSRGRSSSFGRGSKAVMNASTFMDLMANANAADLFGRRTQYGSTVNTVAEANKLIREQGDDDDVPQIAVYDKGYYSDGNDGRTKGTWYPFIANNKVVVFGRRDSGAKLGEYRVTRNFNNEGSRAGFFSNIRDLSMIRSPRAIQIERGHNGGTAIYFPGDIVILTV